MFGSDFYNCGGGNECACRGLFGSGGDSWFGEFVYRVHDFICIIEGLKYYLLSDLFFMFFALIIFSHFIIIILASLILFVILNE